MCEIGPFGVQTTHSIGLSFAWFTQNIMTAHTLTILKFLKKGTLPSTTTFIHQGEDQHRFLPQWMQTQDLAI